MAQVQGTKERFLGDYRRFAADGGGRPGWLRTLRDRAIARFDELGFPTSRQEEWRFTNVQPVIARPFVPAADPATMPARDDLGDLLIGARGPALVFVNGRFQPSLSLTEGLPPGVRFTSLSQAALSDRRLVEPHLGQYAAFDRNPFTALSTAFLGDGAFVYVPPRTVLEAPIQALYVTVAGDDYAASFPRTLVVLDREAQATLVETYAGLGGGTYLTGAVSEAALGDGARLRYYRVQRESERGYHIAATHTRQGRDATLSSCAVVLGAALARHEIGAVLGGTGATAVLDGLSVLGGNQHADHHTTLDHAEPHCESHELFNGIYHDRSRGVFTGRIVVRPGAQRTDSKQTSNNLLLSEEARADSQPQLEIYADDVKCTHGATLGPLDANAMFYLRSRGVSPGDARALLTYGFGAEIIGRVEVPEVRGALDRVVRARLASRGSPWR